MNKQEAIEWCNLHITAWPRSTKWQHPDDWRWVVSRKPYRQPEFTLVNGNHDEIIQADWSPTKKEK